MKKTVSYLMIACLLAGVFAGCGKADETTVPVQSVSMILGFSDIGIADRFSGIVVSRGETKVFRDKDKEIDEILVEQGDEVEAGDILFTYDMELAELNLEKADLELQRLNGTLSARQRELEQLIKDRDKAKEEDKLRYTLEIESCETDIREQNYNISLKEKEVERMRTSLEVRDFASPVSGRIRKINDSTGGDGYDPGYEYGYGDGSDDSFMTIIEAGTYRVKGLVNENNAAQVCEGAQVLVRSRTDDRVWSGMISMIDWDNPDQNNNNMYYGPVDEMSSSTRYPFYIELDASEGLLLGQHVYIEQDFGLQETETPALMLPSWYMTEINEGTAVVFAEDKNGRLEKRQLTLGTYDEMTDAWEVLDGLTMDDFITMPAEDLTEGMRCSEFDENTFEPDPAADGVMDMPLTEDEILYEGPVE